MKELEKRKTISLVQIGLMSAIVYIATAIIYIPSITGKGVIHLGDSAVLISAILLGRKKGAISSAIGMSLFDILSSYTIWSPFTFVIKGLMAYIAATIAYRGNFQGKNLLNNIFGCILASIVMIIGYFFTGWILYGFPAAVAGIPGNIAQALAGTIIAVPLSMVLKKHIKIN